MTERLYYLDPYVRDFRAQIAEIADDGRRLYLDRTAFYPNSGGQPSDLGTICGIRVLDVIDEGERIAHLLEAPLADSEVSGHIDWDRRYDHMQQHTGQHLLSAVFHQLFGFPTLSFHMGADVSTIELGTKAVTEQQIEAAEQRVAEIVAEARPVSISFETADNVEGLRKASARSGDLRIIAIQGIDKSACGGTHLRSTAEIGYLQVRKSEKLRGNVRIEFVCGARALRRSRADYRILADLSCDVAVPIDSLPGQIAGWKQRLAQVSKEAHRLAVELARRDGEQMCLTAKPGSDGLRRLLLRVAVIDEETRVKAQAAVGAGRALVLAFTTAGPAVLIAASQDAGINAGEELKRAIAHSGGKGGGSATVAQGSLTSSEALKELLRDLSFELPRDPEPKEDDTAREERGRQD